MNNNNWFTALNNDNWFNKIYIWLKSLLKLHFFLLNLFQTKMLKANLHAMPGEIIKICQLLKVLDIRSNLCSFYFGQTYFFKWVFLKMFCLLLTVKYFILLGSFVEGNFPKNYKKLEIRLPMQLVSLKFEFIDIFDRVCPVRKRLLALIFVISAGKRILHKVKSELLACWILYVADVIFVRLINLGYSSKYYIDFIKLLLVKLID